MKIGPSSFRLLTLRASFLLVLGLIGGATRSHAQTLLNGSFESPAVSIFTKASGTSWTAPQGNDYLVPNSAGDGTTPYGNQYLVLYNTGDSDVQTINSGFTINQRYELALECTTFFPNENIGQLTLSVTGSLIATQAFVIPLGNGGFGGSGGPLPFVGVALDFTVTTTGPVTITLADTTSGNNALAIDNVTLRAIPEPKTWVIVIGGLGLLLAGTTHQRLRA